MTSNSEKRITVSCGHNCGAFEEPETLEEYKLTLDHYKSHSWLGGCSHGQ